MTPDALQEQIDAVWGDINAWARTYKSEVLPALPPGNEYTRWEQECLTMSSRIESSLTALIQAAMAVGEARGRAWASEQLAGYTWGPYRSPVDILAEAEAHLTEKAGNRP